MPRGLKADTEREGNLNKVLTVPTFEKLLLRWVWVEEWVFIVIDEKYWKCIALLVQLISFPFGTLQDPGLWYQTQET